MRRPTTYRGWFVLAWIVGFGIPGVFHFLLLVGTERWDRLQELGRGSLGVVAVLLITGGLAAICRHWWPAQPKPPKSPQQKDWEFVEETSLGLQIVTAPFAVFSFLNLAINRLSGKGWDEGAWRAGLLCVVLFVAMQLFRDHARKRIGPGSPTSAC